jgi:hypothetical protein
VLVLVASVEVAILVVMVGLNWTGMSGFVVFTVRMAVFVDVFVQGWHCLGWC